MTDRGLEQELNVSYPKWRAQKPVNHLLKHTPCQVSSTETPFFFVCVKKKHFFFCQNKKERFITLHSVLLFLTLPFFPSSWRCQSLSFEFRLSCDYCHCLCLKGAGEFHFSLMISIAEGWNKKSNFFLKKIRATEESVMDWGFEKESLSKGRLAEWDESCVLSSDSAYLCSALMLEKYPEDLFIPLRFFFWKNLYKEPEFLVFVKLVWIAECQRFNTSLQINNLSVSERNVLG